MLAHFHNCAVGQYIAFAGSAVPATEVLLQKGAKIALTRPGESFDRFCTWPTQLQEAATVEESELPFKPNFIVPSINGGGTTKMQNLMQKLKGMSALHIAVKSGDVAEASKAIQKFPATIDAVTPKVRAGLIELSSTT